MTRTAILRITCVDDNAPVAHVIIEAQIDPPVKPGEASLVAQTVTDMKRIMQRAGNSVALQNALDSCPACDDPMILEDM